MTNSIVEFVCHLSDLSINLEADGDRLRCHAPEGVLTPTLRQEIAGRKTEIMLFLQQAKQLKAAHQLPIQRVPRNNNLPLSFAQQRLWFLHQLSPESHSYNMLAALRLEGLLNIVALEQSLNELIRRHEVLRTTFLTVDGKPVQVIAPPSFKEQGEKNIFMHGDEIGFTLPVYNLQGLSAEEQTDQIRQIAKSLASQSCDLAVGPLVQFTLLQLSNQECVLLLKMHHIIYDGWSLNIFNRELSQLYVAFTQGLPNPLPELPIQYADFAVWQRQWLTGEVLERQLNYWQQQLAGVPLVLELPGDRPRPPVQSFRGGVECFQLDRNLTQRLKQLSQESDTTLFMTLLAAFLVLISRYSGQSNVVVGSPIANRNSSQVEQLMGFFANTLALRGDLSGNPTFAEFLAQVRQTTLSAYAHQDLPFEMLVEKLQPERDLSRNPLVQVMFALQNAPQASWNLPGLTIHDLPLPLDETVRFDLEVNCQEVMGVLEGIWSYSTDLFDATTITRIAQHFQTLLQAIVANPKARISEFPLLTPAEQQQLLVEWNNTTKAYPQYQCIHQLFESQAQRTPDAIAVIFAGQKLTYRQLNEQANQLAHYLQSLGVTAEVMVGLCVERSLEMVVGLLGILKAGGVYVPIDPAYPKERIAHILSDSHLPILLTQQKLVTSLPNHQGQVVCLDTIGVEISAASEFLPTNSLTPENLAYVIYTSGSTGKPKGVAIAHRGLCNLATAQIRLFGVQQDSCVLQFASLSFDASISEIFMAICAGAKLYLGSPEELQPGPALLGLLQQQRITHVTLVPSALAALPVDELPALQTLIVAGEACPANLVDKWSGGRRFFNAYGPTESTVCATVAQCQQGKQAPPIGRPIDNTQIYILDSDLQPVPIGVPGELYIAGVGLARGYLNRPDLTNEKFIPNPFQRSRGAALRLRSVTGSRGRIENQFANCELLYKTGDLARYLPDGNIEYLGRIDNQVKIRGFRIELGEVEAVLSQHPAVRETVVVVQEDIPERKYLAAYIVFNQNLATTNSELRGFLKEKLPNYMIPGVFVILDALPLTPNGKVDRRSLSTPQTAHQELTATKVAPRTWIEKTLAQIWCEVLHRELVSIHDNFFELGGDSIVSIQIISKANQAGLQLNPKQIFEHQTIAELASVARAAVTVQAEQGQVTGLLPLTPIQHWFFTQNLPAFHHFNQAFLLEVPQVFDPILLSQVVQQLLVHHDALRLRFVQSGEYWQQVNTESDDIIPFSQIDLSTIPDAGQKATIETAAAELQASFNLSSGPLVQVAFFALGNDKPSRLLIVIHHLAVDGVSWRILLEDLFSGYQQLSHGKEIQFSPKTTSFKDWALRLREYAQSNTLKSELAYWEAQLPQQVLSIPVDYACETNTVASARTVSVSLNIEETRALLQEVPKAYQTQINDVLLTVLVQVLGKWSGDNSLLLDLEGHGREDIFDDVDLSRTVGWFTTIFPVLLTLKATDNLGDSLRSIKEQLRTVPNRGIGYGLLRYLSRDAEITSKLLALAKAEVSFNYLGQFDWGMREASIFKIAPESIGSGHSLLGYRSYLLAINSIVLEGQLQVDWTYSENVHQLATIESLAQDFVEALRSLIAHCLTVVPENYTFDESNNQVIDDLAQQLNTYQSEENKLPLPLHLLELPEEISEFLPEDTESVYPLAKMQEFMLHHYSNTRQKTGVYHCQQSYDFEDNTLSLNAFQKALELLVQKHPTFRTVFIILSGKPVAQVVKNSLNFSITQEDISHIKSNEQESYIDTVMKWDQQNLFQILNPNQPLFRFWIFQKAENRFEFLMSIHHAIIDGWSNIEFINELYELYSALKKGEEITIATSDIVYKEFVALEKEIIESKNAVNFWKHQLKNHIYRPLNPLTTPVEEIEAVTEKYDFSSEIVANLRQLCGRLRVSPKAIFLSTYLDIIKTEIQENTVTVGIVSNGRTERLSEPFRTLGLFWNMVPFSQPTIEDKSLQIKNVHQSLINMEPYVRYPLLQILSDQEKTELFFATFNFVQFRNSKNILAHAGLNVNGIKSHDQFNFPLNYTVSMDFSVGNISIAVKYDKMYFSYKDICSMLNKYIELLKHTLHPEADV
ncbi:MAG: amino acid adenylation domain-containing protein [Desmonostoc vinosum HA7617-LM4]|jgi:amino acid adenylation domain-containing protein/non-ribosomal peptide synthase protein (TIGR01720 family)|nr:amino acid adenylation domain-containing protein [Desmonostoc vinosum HA7617-LM4]